MPTLSLDVLPSAALARRLETTEVNILQAGVLAAEQSGWALPVAGGMATYCRPNSPLNRVLGLGFRALDLQALRDLERVERAYAVAQTAICVEVCTYASPALTNTLVARGYRFTGNSCVLGRSLDPQSPPPLPRAAAALHTRRITDAEVHLWADVLAQGYQTLPRSDDVDESAPPVEALRAAFLDISRAPHLQRWLAEFEGQAVGGAALEQHGDIALLSHGLTLPAFHRRGVQLALLAARLAQASCNGCSLAVLTAPPGSSAQHDAQQLGFVPLYGRALWTR